MNCRDIKRNLSAYLDKEVDKQQTMQIEQHLLDCEKCKDEFDILSKVNDEIVALHKQTELPDGLRQEILKRVKSVINSISVQKSNDTFLNVKEGIYIKVTKNAKWLFSITGLLILLLAVFLNGDDLSNMISSPFSKGHPAYIIEERYFKNIEKAQRYINDIPFVVPRCITSDFKLKEIVYCKTKDNSSSVVFNYINNDFNELKVEYFSRGNDSDIYYDIGLISPNFINIKTDQGMGLSQYNTNATSPTQLTGKRVEVDLPKYCIRVHLSYNREATTSDNQDDEMLLKVTEGYLQSEIFTAKNDSDIIIDAETTKFNSFSELKQSIPSGIMIKEPKYIPQGFELKYITYKRHKENPIHYFNITTVYEHENGTFLLINYKQSGEGGIHANNDNKLGQRDAYRIQINEDGKGYFVKYIEKQLPYRFASFDLNIYMQYKVENSDYSGDYNNELRKIVNSLK